MNMDDAFEIVRLVGAEIDDQAIVEISRLVRAYADGAEVSPSWLIRVAAEGPLLVARRPCGAQPEIIAVAGLSPDRGEAGGGREIVALDPSHAGRELEPALRAALLAQTASSSRFQGRHRPPFGSVRPCPASVRA